MPLDTRHELTTAQIFISLRNFNANLRLSEFQADLFTYNSILPPL